MKGKLIWVILALGFLIRVVSLVAFPAGFNADEASFGYDAHSILNTGKDQWGTKMPLVLKSFGDYKSPAYAYLSIPIVSLFGLNIFSVRIAGVLMGTLSILSVYLLTKKLSGSKTIGLLSAIFLALNPWSVMLGRGAFESNLITFFLPMAIYLFLERKYTLSSLMFGISLFTYHSAKVIVPLVLVGLVLINYKDLVKTKFKLLIPSLLILSLFLIGFVYSFKLGGGARIAERSITQGALIQGFDDRMKAISKGVNPRTAKLVHNKYTVIVDRFVNNYLQYFSSKFLIKDGAGEGSYGMIPGIGVIHLFELIAFLGIVPLLLKKKEYRRVLILLILWLLITPLPAALASGVGYAGNRAIGMIPVIQIISAFGVMGWVELLRKRRNEIQYALLGGFLILGFFNSVNFVNEYFKIPTNGMLRQMGYGYLEVSKYLGEQAESRNILVSRSLSEPQIFFAFALKMDPNVMQEATKNWDLKGNNVVWVDQIPSYQLGRFTIKSIDWEKDVKSGSLIVVRPDEKTPDFIPIKTFYYPDGSPNVLVLDSNQKIYAKSD
jgi:4-amino-4-deoxy-L-arabinose transferase-like glycosyltransferase